MALLIVKLLNNIDKDAFSGFVDSSKANASKASTWGVIKLPFK